MQEQAVVSVIEDDEPTRDVICEMASSMGLKVNPFVSAEDFLQRYTKSQLECMVLDVRMPGISGMDLMAELADKDVHIPTIIRNFTNRIFPVNQIIPVLVQITGIRISSGHSNNCNGFFKICRI